MELRETILEGTIQAFNKKGLKFTMDDIAALLGISKKTIYTVFQDKNTLVSEMVDYCFDSIKESEQKVLSDASLDTVGKIRAILGVLPEGYKDIDFRQLYLPFLLMMKRGLSMPLPKHAVSVMCWWFMSTGVWNIRKNLRHIREHWHRNILKPVQM